MNLDSVQHSIHYQFKHVKYLETALTHSSYANEQEDARENNERLEFLGDAVLELCVAEELYKRFPDAREGDLTRMRAALVSKPTLSELARELALDNALLLGKGEASQGGRLRKALLGDVLEAVLGAIFLDGGYLVAKEWVHATLASRWPENAESEKAKDPKSRLQECTQKWFKDRPVYVLEATTGPEHAKEFHVRVTLPNKETFLATGPSMKKAEQKAALLALHSLAQGLQE
jgi:ribonuclease-3